MMKQLDRLLIKAQQLARGGVELILAMVLPDGDLWTAEAHLWDGTKGHAPTIERSTWPTMDAAVEHIHEVAKDHPNGKDVPIIVDDL